MRWFVEGDIKGCFDNIDHDVLVGLINSKIKDTRMMKLIYKFLKVPNPPDSGKDIAKSKGVPGNWESEGSWRQITGLPIRSPHSPRKVRICSTTPSKVSRQLPPYPRRSVFAS